MNHEELLKMSAEDLTAHMNKLIKEDAQAAEGEALKAIVAEIEDCKAIIADANTRKQLASMAVVAEPTANAVVETAKASTVKAMEERGAKAKKGAEVKYSAQIVSRKVKASLSVDDTAPVVHTASDVKPTFNDVSALVDRVKVITLSGGETYQRGYVKSYGAAGGITAEGAAYTSVEPEFGYVTISKEKVTAYAEEPEEMTKLPNADYDEIVESSVSKALRKKLNAQILTGDGSTGTVKGIFYNPASATDDVIDRDTDLGVAAIDNTTLDEIIYSYGGDEDVESIAVLILNKKDLKAFAMLRDQDGRKVYAIVNNGNTGTIDGVPFIINSACKAISDSNTSTNAYCMAYGALENFELAVFANIDARRSDDYKFKEGQIAYRASMLVGGAVAAFNGFIRVKKAASNP